MKNPIDPIARKQIIPGPRGSELTLDVDEIYPEDPGAGTPAIVECGKANATFWCAASEGEDADGNRFPEVVYNWLSEIEPLVGDWLDIWTTTRRMEDKTGRTLPR